MNWQDILSAGSLNDQQGQIDQQLADVLARRRAYRPGEHTTGLGALLGGIGDYRAQMRFRDQEDALRQQRQDVGGKLTGARGMLADALTGASQPVQAPPDMIAAPGFDQASQERAQQQNLQHAQIAAMLSGDPTMAQYAQHAPQMALQQQHLEQGAQSFPLQQAMERQKLANAAPSPALGGLTPEQATAQAHQGAVSKFAVNPVSGRIYDTRTGQEVSGSGGAGAALSDKRLPGMQEKFARDLDPNISRGGLPKENQQRVNAADRIMALAVGKDPLTGQEAMNDLTPQQMTELATSAAALLSSGGGDAGTRHEMTPYTKGRTWAQVVQWLTDKPHGADQQAFVKQIVDMSRREQGVAQGQIRTAQQQRLGNHLGYFSLFPDQAKSQLEHYGWNPEEVDLKTGKYTPKPPPPPQASPEDTAAIDWLKANQNHPDAPGVVAKLKSKGLVK